MSETRYVVTVRTDAAHGLEIVLEHATSVMLSLKGPYPHGGRGFDVTSVERVHRDAEIEGTAPLFPR